MQRLSKDEIERSFDDEVDPEIEREIDEARMDMGRDPRNEYRSGCPILSEDKA